MSEDTLLKVLRGARLKVVEHRQWRTNRRPSNTGAFGPVHGIMNHHTVTSGDTHAQTMASVNLCYDGYSSLPGPLGHGVVAKDGTVYLVGNGRANHAGKGDRDVLDAVIAERPVPPDNEADTDGNVHFYGFEFINRGDGKDPWPAAQIEAMVRINGAIARHHRWTYLSCIRHLDWQPGKIDPRGVDWPAVQKRIDLFINPPKTPTQGVSMALTTAEIKAIAEEVAKLLLRTDGQYLAPKDAADWSSDPSSLKHWWSGTSAFDSITTATRQNRTMIRAILEHLGIEDPTQPPTP